MRDITCAVIFTDDLEVKSLNQCFHTSSPTIGETERQELQYCCVRCEQSAGKQLIFPVQKAVNHRLKTPGSFECRIGPTLWYWCRPPALPIILAFLL